MNKAPQLAAVLLLNDTFPNPLGILAALVAWILPVVVIALIVVRLVRRRELVWPSPLIAAVLFVGLFILAVLADTRFPHARPVEDAIGFVATVFLFPAMMLILPFDFASSPLSHASARPTAGDHLALAAAGAVFWYLALLATRLLFARRPEPKATAPDERLWL